MAVPMIVELDGSRCEVSEWNVGGFAPETPLPGPRLKEVRTAHVILRIGDVEVGFDIPCQVTRETELGAAEFKFLGAFTEQAALLYRVAEDRLAGYATQFDRSCLLNRFENPATEENSSWARWYRYCDQHSDAWRGGADLSSHSAFACCGRDRGRCRVARTCHRRRRPASCLRQAAASMKGSRCSKS